MGYIADEPLCNAAQPRRYQMPKNGDWIALDEITAIIARPASLTHSQAADVVVRLNTGEHRFITCESFAEAMEIRDQIATAQGDVKRS